MSASNENPPAFPLRGVDSNGFYTPYQTGMTLRDWFAGQALGAVGDSFPDWQLRAWFGERTGIPREEIRAKAAYAIADAMIAARGDV